MGYKRDRVKRRIGCGVTKIRDTRRLRYGETKWEENSGSNSEKNEKER